MVPEQGIPCGKGLGVALANTSYFGIFCLVEKQRALVLEFTLPKAAYATMAIRELMKKVVVVQ